MQGDLSLFPLAGTMLGGTQVFVSGPCFNESSDIVCDFDGTSVTGELITTYSASCVAPTFDKVGRFPLRVSLDGGSTFNFEGTYTLRK